MIYAASSVGYRYSKVMPRFIGDTCELCGDIDRIQRNLDGADVIYSVSGIDYEINKGLLDAGAISTNGRMVTILRSMIKSMSSRTTRARIRCNFLEHDEEDPRLEFYCLLSG